VHELSICSSIAEIAARHADGRSVERISVLIGHFRQVVPTTLTFCWELVTEGTDLSGSELEVIDVPAVIRCRACTHEHELSEPVLQCPRCSSFDVELTAGEELQVLSLDLTEV
jgi:hydrogenase nickel incorporation protein HypA/HybF